MQETREEDTRCGLGREVGSGQRADQETRGKVNTRINMRTENVKEKMKDTQDTVKSTFN